MDHIISNFSADDDPNKKVLGDSIALASNQEHPKTPMQERAKRPNINNLIDDSNKKYKKHLSGRYGPRGSYKKRKTKD